MPFGWAKAIGAAPKEALALRVAAAGLAGAGAAPAPGAVAEEERPFQKEPRLPLGRTVPAGYPHPLLAGAAPGSPAL